MIRFASLNEAKQSGFAFIHVTGKQATDGTLRYDTKISLIGRGGGERPIVRRWPMTLEEIASRVDKEAKKRGVGLGVMELPPLVLATISGAM